VLSSADIFRFFGCGRPNFLAQKTSEFSKFMVCQHGQGGRGLSQCEHFSDKGEGVNFSRFCADVLYERPLQLLTFRVVSRLPPETRLPPEAELQIGPGLGRTLRNVPCRIRGLNADLTTKRPYSICFYF